MCIRDRNWTEIFRSGISTGTVLLIAAIGEILTERSGIQNLCLLYTSDAADDLPCVDLGGRRIIKKKNKKHICRIL